MIDATDFFTKAPPFDRPLVLSPDESGRGKMGKSDAFTLCFAGTASIHFHKALSFVNMLSSSISVYFSSLAPPIDWKKITSVFAKDEPI